MIDLTIDIPSQQWRENKPRGKLRVSKGRSWVGRKVDISVGKKRITLIMDKDDLRKFAARMVELSEALLKLEA